MRRLLLCLVLLFAATTLHASTTPAEKLANDAAQHELDSSPCDGNIPSYSLTPENLAKGQHLEHVGNLMHFGGAIWGIVYLVLLLSTGVVGALQSEVTSRFRNRWLQCFYFLLLFGIITSVLDLPLALYGHWLRLHYGLSVQGWGSWIGDQLKSSAIGWFIGGLLTMLLFLIIRKLPRSWWFAFWLCSIPIILAGIFVTPYVIDPVFNKFEPLSQSHPELVQRLEQVVHRGNMDIPPERMFLMKASAKVTTLNAYVTGFGASKRVVVWDTSITKGTPDEIMFIFGHESGHYVLNHIVQGLLFSIVILLLAFYLGYRFVTWAIRRFGPSWGIASQVEWGMLPIFLLAFSLFSLVLEPITSTATRSREHDADVYGQEAIHGLVADPQAVARGAFQVLGETSFDDPNPSQFIEFWTYGHPSIGRRAAFATHYNPWAAGMQPKYFQKP
ncbi:Zn-dependent protease with chaperone function [Terriglobus roseus DSM 18391]|uniref:Zn-dependent protease with chaperone function n=1 Tax=Terriglobus roseus (strain DSM 18391 / NRRL B-41598 / KBS 63) TaxID=926566 RepID=I3ZIE7_TERRK|nr:M48 family metallopeptidase [Terriglobus roseus]AFL89015.1 Zn-dependent protease with chaperone function [Terriglobus roseus DSM 18391]